MLCESVAAGRAPVNFQCMLRRRARVLCGSVAFRNWICHRKWANRPTASTAAADVFTSANVITIIRGMSLQFERHCLPTPTAANNCVSRCPPSRADRSNIQLEAREKERRQHHRENATHDAAAAWKKGLPWLYGGGAKLWRSTWPLALISRAV